MSGEGEVQRGKDREGVPLRVDENRDGIIGLVFPKALNEELSVGVFGVVCAMPRIDHSQLLYNPRNIHLKKWMWEGEREGRNERGR